MWRKFHLQYSLALKTANLEIEEEAPLSLISSGKNNGYINHLLILH